MPITPFRLPIGDFRLAIFDWRLPIASIEKSEIANRQSAMKLAERV